MIAAKTWKEIRVLTLLYVVLLEVQVAISIFLWPWLRDQSPALARIMPAKFLQRIITDITGQDESAAFRAYMALQTFFKGANIMGLAFAIVFGAIIVAREREAGTLEFLLARPVSRARVLAVKFGVIATALTVPIFLTSWSTIPLSWIPPVEENLPFAEITLASAYSSLFCILFLAATTAISVRARTQLTTISVVGAFAILNLAIYFVQKVRTVSIFRLSDYDLYGPLLAGNVRAIDLFLQRGVWILLATVLLYLLALGLFRKAEL